jgi:hypothetical protein
MIHTIFCILRPSFTGTANCFLWLIKCWQPGATNRQYAIFTACAFNIHKNIKFNYSVLKMLPMSLPAINANKNWYMCIECRYVYLFIYWRIASCLLSWWRNKLRSLITMRAEMNNLITLALHCFMCSLTANKNLQHMKLMKWNYKDFKGKVFKLLLCRVMQGCRVTNILLHSFFTREL